MNKAPFIVTVIFAALLMQRCSLPYYAQAVRGQVELLRKRTPIEEVMSRADTDPALAEELARVLEMRSFASVALALPDNGSYRSYADLGRPYVVWNVVATEEFSVEPVSWCFIFVGCLSYRGFFKQQAAEAFARELVGRELDTFVGGVTAYSTLGYFDDPVLNTMLARGEAYVAGLIFHELAHQRLYVKGDSAFSEAFATVVEEYGTTQWLAARGSDAALRDYQARLVRRDQFGALVSRQVQRLRDLYASELEPAAMRQAKSAAFGAMRAEYESLKAAWGGAGDYDGWFGATLNNAHLAAVITYRQWVPFLNEQLHAAADIRDFYRLAEQFAAMDSDERNDRLDGWLLAARTSDPPVPAAGPAGAGVQARPGTQAQQAP
jgi:predicted aminopeptidase